MQDIIQSLLQYGYVVLFVWVLLEQAGLPIPAAPMLMAAGALVALGWLSLPVAILVAVLGALPSDLAWYYVGRFRGTAALNVVCRIALEPDSCVRRTQNVFARYGLRSLLFVKFVPGLNAVAAPLAGAFEARLRSFLSWDLAGALLWASGFVGLGYLLSDQIEFFARAVADLGLWAAVLLGGALALFITGKYLQRRRFLRQLRIDRITPEDLRRKLEARFTGRPQHELEARLREPLPCESPPRKLRLAIQVLARLRPRDRKTAVPPRRARALVFGEAARTSAPPHTALSTVATSLGVSPEALQDSLFGDLPGERLVGAPAQPLSAMELALRCNLALVQALLFRATAVRIEVEGNTRALVRHAKWRGLICAVAERSGTADATVELSGPFALFRNTRLYGRALGELVPLLAWCPRFRLRAECVFQGRRLTLQLGTGDPIFPASAPRRYDSRLEERFARQFRRLAPAWDVIREPEPIAAGGTLIFPDFALQHRSDAARRWLLEIVGFWTPNYVARKLALYRSARLSNRILCIDEDRNCAEADLPFGALVVRFRRHGDSPVGEGAMLDRIQHRASPQPYPSTTEPAGPVPRSVLIADPLVADDHPDGRRASEAVWQVGQR